MYVNGVRPLTDENRLSSVDLRPFHFPQNEGNSFISGGYPDLTSMHLKFACLRSFFHLCGDRQCINPTVSFYMHGGPSDKTSAGSLASYLYLTPAVSTAFCIFRISSAITGCRSQLNLKNTLGVVSTLFVHRQSKPRGR
jgi:hypothetical protein